MNAVFFYRLLFTFFWWNICSFNGPVVAHTDHYMNSHSVWVVFSFLSCYQDGLYHLEQAKDCVGMSCNDCCMVVIEEGGSIWLLWPHVCISIHLHLTFSPGKCMPRDWAFCLSRFRRSHLRSCWHQAMSKINTEPLVFSILSTHPFSQVLRHRNGPWKWLDAVDVHQISCLSYCPWWIFSVPRKTFNFEKVPMVMRVWPPPGTHHSTPLKAAFPSDSPSLRTCPLTRSLTSFGSAAATVVQKNTFHVILPFRPEREGYIMPCFGSFQRKCLPSFSVSSFILSSTCLIVRTKRIVELMNVLCCYYLLACACMDLLFLCLGGKKGRGDRNPGLKKKKTRSILYTM